MAPPAKCSIFWSWQSDSPPGLNRSFVQGCLERAAKNIHRVDGVVMAVDRDTKGVGGTPNISETILAKIRRADVFVWDATLVYRRPKPSPNPNVLLEHGYALALLGEGRMVGIMNTALGGEPANLPFDLRHRRWPLTYELSRETWFQRVRKARFNDLRERIRKKVIKDLESAIRGALSEPKRSAIGLDSDRYAAQALWNDINSKWMFDWWEERSDYPQHERRGSLDRFEQYRRLAQHPECAFVDDMLRSLHDGLVTSIARFLNVNAIEMVPSSTRGEYIASVKERGAKEWIDGFDQKYERQIERINDAVQGVWTSWRAYVQELARRYPDVVH